MYSKTDEIHSAPLKGKLVARSASIGDRVCTAELAKFLRDTRPSYFAVQSDSASKYTMMTPRPARPEHNSQLLELAEFLRESGPEHDTLVDTDERGTESSIDSDTAQQANDQGLHRFSRLTSGNLKTVMGRIRRLPTALPKTEMKAIRKGSASSSVNLSETSVAIASHGSTTKKSLLYGSFKIPRQYYWRDRFDQDNTPNSSQTVLETGAEDITLCFHPMREGHLKSCKMLSLARRNFVLDASGWVFQYSLTVSTEPVAEEAFHITAESVAVATDAIPGELWCLRLSNRGSTSTQLQTLPSIGEDTTTVKSDRDMLIIFPDSEKFATWMSTIKGLIGRRTPRSSLIDIQEKGDEISRSSAERWSHVVEMDKVSCSTNTSRETEFITPLSDYKFMFDANRSRTESRAILEELDEDTDKSSTRPSSVSTRLSTPDGQSPKEAIWKYCTSDQKVETESIAGNTLADSPSRSVFHKRVRDGSQSSIISHSLFEKRSSATDDEVVSNGASERLSKMIQPLSPNGLAKSFSPICPPNSPVRTKSTVMLARNEDHYLHVPLGFSQNGTGRPSYACHSQSPSHPTGTSPVQVTAKLMDSCKGFTSISETYEDDTVSPLLIPGRGPSLGTYFNKPSSAAITEHEPQLPLPSIPRGSLSDLWDLLRTESKSIRIQNKVE